MGTEVQTTVRVDEELLKAVKRAVIERDSNQTRAITEGLRLWLGEKPQPPTQPESLTAGLSATQRQIVERVVDLLRSGSSPRAVRAIRDILDLISEP